MSPPSLERRAASPARAGVFIVLEGPEGAGKSTQIRVLASRLAALGRHTVLTREPGGTRAGDAIRHVLLDPGQRIEPLAEFLLYSASRAQLVEEVIAPALYSGQDVISDRFTGASVAYQGYGRGLDLDLIYSVNTRVTHGLTPDLTVLLDIDPAVGLGRAAARSSHDRLEAESLEFHERVRSGFVAQANTHASWLLVDGGVDEAEVAEIVWGAVEPLLTKSAGRVAR
ncbi:MAG TPA: dTMP kinase [Trueperaceae bacterium]|nr:dTMP kinase [Trueperaceae bacterium]